ncbi:MAG: DUF4097 family beta strand repeat protein [Chloroflexi bacterium]|nr:DUF4097 family beta strand repeat protein [Chloroflexota bacterium]
MSRQTFHVSENAHIQIRACRERVTVIGWDETNLVTADDAARQDGDTIIVENSERANVHMPRAARVSIADCTADVRVENITGRVELANIEGDVIARALSDALARDLDGDFVAKDVAALRGEGVWDGDVALRGIEKLDADGIDGDVSMGSVGAINIRTVRGDLSARGVRTALVIGDVEGDVSVRGAEGQLTFERVGSDLAISDLRGGLDARDVEGDVALTISQIGETHLRADGDVVVHLPADANAEIELDALRGDLMVSGDLKIAEQDESHLRGTLGSGGVMVQIESTRGDLILNAGAAREHAHHREDYREFAEMGQRIAKEVRESVRASLGDVRVKARVGKHQFGFHGFRHRHPEPPIPPIPPIPPMPPQREARGLAEGSPERKAILDAIARGEMNVDDAIKKLKGE